MVGDGERRTRGTGEYGAAKSIADELRVPAERLAPAGSVGRGGALRVSVRDSAAGGGLVQCSEFRFFDSCQFRFLHKPHRAPTTPRP